MYEFTGSVSSEESKKASPVAELEWVYCPRGPVGEQRRLLHMLAGHVAGEGVGDDGGVGGGDPVASDDVAGGEFGLFHAYERPGLFRGPAGQVVCCLAFGAGCGIDPVVGEDADPVAKVQNDGNVAEDQVPQSFPPGLHDGYGGGGCAGVGEVAGVSVLRGGVADC